MAIRRAVGVFCPISALPSQSGVGNFGPAAYRFVDWLAAAGQTHWQILPLTIPDSLGSPYAPPSSQAGNWMFISIEQLVKQKRFPDPGLPPENHRSIRHRQVARDRWLQLHAVYAYWQKHASQTERRAFSAYQHRSRHWLIPFTLYASIKEAQNGQPWWEWPKHYQTPQAAAQYGLSKLQPRRQFQAWLQWMFDQQWQELKTYAKKRGLKIIGDIPFYPPMDSVDVWFHPQLFHLDAYGRPKAVAGVPPDVFSTTGQKWGNPVYRWSGHRRDHFRWWRERIDHAMHHYDVVRLDHFIGYLHTWHVKPRAKSGREGNWVTTPGLTILKMLTRRWPPSRFLVDDLGSNTPAIEQLRKQSKMKGTRVFVFGWSGLHKNIHHPNAIKSDFAYYTSTHDSNTVMGWWRQEAKWYERKHLREFLGRVGTDLNWHVIRLVARSKSTLVIIPIQDIFGLGSRSRLNKPGRKHGNWSWRFSESYLTARLAQRLRKAANRHD